VAAQFLFVKDFDGAVELVGSLRLTNPVASLRVIWFVTDPAYEFRRNGLRHAAGYAAFVVDVEACGSLSF
jgi:hypothetical protein